MVLLGALRKNIVPEIKWVHWMSINKVLYVKPYIITTPHLASDPFICRFSINICKVSPQNQGEIWPFSPSFYWHRTDNLFTVVYQTNPQLGTGTTIFFLKVSNACYNKASENPWLGNGAWSFWIQISSNEVLWSGSSQWVIELYNWYVFNLKYRY